MTRVALLWHMHQPFYQDLATGEHVLPWVRLHAIKDYWGMVATLAEFPSVKVTFNLVPSLLVQLDAFAREQAKDRHLDIGLKPAEELSDDERAFCLEQFFHAHHTRMIQPYPRYAELLSRRGREADAAAARAAVGRFSVDDFRDLQVWHKLVWIDHEYLTHDSRTRRLVTQGRGFTEEDKLILREIEIELLRNVIPEYRRAAERGQIELSTSAFYHPILPLLCDTDVYLRTHPHSAMPRGPFRHPEDAAEQLVRASQLHAQLFGIPPAGLWPPEGGVSDAVVSLAAEAGFRWIATDEEILGRTLGHAFRSGDGQLNQPELLYRPYRVGPAGKDVACGFRDHTLSDLIGFTYATWPAEAAAADLVNRLVAAGRSRQSGQEPTVFIILDGENAWEHYEGQGRPFLRALYARLGSHPELKSVTMAEACREARARLPSIFPGSWINADFYVWIGHDDDRRAWSQLVDARRVVDLATAGLSRATLNRAKDELLIAEGSDWFWWYGDDHSSEHDREFDDLFRRHVRNVYQALDRPIPEELFVSNITTQPPALSIYQPTGPVRPILDGVTTSYFEWLAAGCVDASPAAGTMHQVSERTRLIDLVRFGFDGEYLFLCLQGPRPMAGVLEQGVELALSFLTPAGPKVTLRQRPDTTTAITLQARPSEAPGQQPTPQGLRAAVRQVAEIQVPLRALGLTTGGRMAFIVGLLRGVQELEHYPTAHPIELTVPGREFWAANWSA
jgi:alpha-amylase/alpha-mannosidase (GH57 family)